MIASLLSSLRSRSSLIFLIVTLLLCYLSTSLYLNTTQFPDVLFLFTPVMGAVSLSFAAVQEGGMHFALALLWLTICLPLLLLRRWGFRSILAVELALSLFFTCCVWMFDKRMVAPEHVVDIDVHYIGMIGIHTALYLTALLGILCWGSQKKARLRLLASLLGAGLCSLPVLLFLPVGMQSYVAGGAAAVLLLWLWAQRQRFLSLALPLPDAVRVKRSPWFIAVLLLCCAGLYVFLSICEIVYFEQADIFAWGVLLAFVVGRLLAIPLLSVMHVNSFVRLVLFLLLACNMIAILFVEYMISTRSTMLAFICAFNVALAGSLLPVLCTELFAILRCIERALAAAVSVCCLTVLLYVFPGVTDVVYALILYATILSFFFLFFVPLEKKEE